MRTPRLGILLLAGGVLLFSGLRMSADEKPKEKPAKELAKDFVYPGAKQLGEDREGARLYQAKLTTPADVGRVTDTFSCGHSDSGQFWMAPFGAGATMDSP
jgi:hypothetical protein